ncbi:hypothetical protein HK096_005441 [Nowakowskiella sp. JEL0078]|nr:hypothetical protein HK096_005441 [Nowakowskiella sp. JEL0078]
MSREKGRKKEKSLNEDEDVNKDKVLAVNIGQISSEEVSRKLTQIMKMLIQQEDRAGRRVAELFLTLPSKEDYPDYYLIIKNPIAFDIIQKKIDTRKYNVISDFLEDFELLVQNASTYNKKGSVVVKNALFLKKLMEKAFWDNFDSKRLVSSEKNVQENFLREESQINSASNVSNQSTKPPPGELKNILKKFSMTKDSTGRSITEYFEELPDTDDYPDYFVVISKPISFEQIQEKITKGSYHTMEQFHLDVNQICFNAMEYNQEGSLVFTHAKILQELLQNGTSLSSKTSNRDKPRKVVQKITEIVQKSVVYKIGDFIHIQNRSEPAKPIIAQIHDFFDNGGGETGMEVCWFVRPENTVHRPSYRFMENEVFKVNHLDNYLVSDILNRCHVLFFRDFVRGKPKDMKENEKLYVCESRYDDQAKNISKIKNWSQCLPAAIRSKTVDLELYDIPLVPTRFVSSFAQLESTPTSRKSSEEIIDIDNDSDDNSIKPNKKRRTSPGLKKENILTPIVQSSLSVIPRTPTPATRSTKHSQSTTAQTPHIQAQPMAYTPVLEKEKHLPARTKWFSTPPVDVVKSDDVEHTLEYLYHKHTQKKEKDVKILNESREHSNEMELDENLNPAINGKQSHDEDISTAVPSWYYPLLNMSLPPTEHWEPHKPFFERVAEIFLGEAYAMRN